MDIGFYIISADQSEQCTPIINTINSMVKNHPYDNIILFNNDYNRIDDNKKFPIIALNQAKYFRGVLICFDVKSLAVTKSFPAPKKQILYLNDTPWVSKNVIPAMFWKTIFENSSLEIIAKTQEIKDICEICWKPVIGMMENINEKELYDTIATIYQSE